MVPVAVKETESPAHKTLLGRLEVKETTGIAVTSTVTVTTLDVAEALSEGH